MLKHPKSEPTKLQLHSQGVRVSGTLLALFLIGVAIFCPETLPDLVNRLLAASIALLAGVFAFFVAAEFSLENRSIRSRFGEIDGKMIAGVGVFLLVLGGWLSPLGPFKQAVKEINATESKPNHQETLALLRHELPIKTRQITLLQRWSEPATRVEPSARARELAAQIPNDADSYALALKSIAQKRFAEARRLLAEAQSKGTDLALLYEARGQTEQYDGHYNDAVPWFEKLFTLQPNDPVVLDKAGAALHLAGGYSEAERLYQRALAITEKSLGSAHPQLAAILTHLAISYYAQGDYEQAEPLLRRALSIQEKALGLDHFNIADSLNNLAGLYYVQGKYSKAEPLLQRAQMILERSVGSNHLEVAQSLNRLYFTRPEIEHF